MREVRRPHQVYPGLWEYYSDETVHGRSGQENDRYCGIADMYRDFFADYVRVGGSCEGDFEGTSDL